MECRCDPPVLKFFKTHPDVPTPNFATEQAACFDLAYHNPGLGDVTAYDEFNKPYTLWPEPGIMLPPGYRALLPTGLIFVIPQGFSLRLHSRSGLALKNGLVLANGEGVIDSDYFHETFMLMVNTSKEIKYIFEGMRLAQAELVPVLSYQMQEQTVRPEQISDRIGGLGSTGTI